MSAEEQEVTVSGQIQYGEGMRWAQRACSRLNGYPWSVLFGLAAGVIAAIASILLASVVVILIDLPRAAQTPVLIALILPAVWLAIRLVQRWQVGRMRRALAERGMASPSTLRYAFTPDAFEVTTERVRVQADWIAVSDVFPVGPYWIFLVDGTPRFVPKRYFLDASTEKRFLATALQYMSVEARSRSAAAVKFASGLT